MDYIVVSNTGLFIAAPELDIRRAMMIYGETPPSVDELRDIADHYCRIMLDAKARVLLDPTVGDFLRSACLGAFDYAILDNAAFVASYR